MFSAWHKILQFFNPRSKSEPGKLELADWIAALRIKIYWICGAAAEYVYDWLSGTPTAGLPWYMILLIGISLGILDLLRRRQNDYRGAPSTQTQNTGEQT